MAARLEELDRERSQLADDMEGERRPRIPHFARHELTELIGQVMRSSDGLMSATGIAAEIADRKHISQPMTGRGERSSSTASP